MGTLLVDNNALGPDVVKTFESLKHFRPAVHIYDFDCSWPPPRCAPTGSKRETITEGGEVVFVHKLIGDSLVLKDKIRIYTTMLGHKSSVKPLTKTLKGLGVTQIAQTVFTQGKTLRWGLAWSFLESSNLTKCAPPKSNKKSKCLGFVIPPIESLKYNVKGITSKFLQIFKDLQLKFKLLQQMEAITTMEIKASKNTWSNQRKRKREEKFKHFNNRIEAVGESGNAETNFQPIGKRLNEDIIDCDAHNPKHYKLELPIGIKCVTKSLNYSVESVRNYACESDIDTNREPQLSCESQSVEDYLTAAVCIRKDDNHIVLEVGFISGISGKDGVHQIVQYIKNNWK